MKLLGGLDPEALCEAYGTPLYVYSAETIIERLVKEATPGDTIALLSNGAFGGIHQRLADALG